MRPFRLTFTCLALLSVGLVSSSAEAQFATGAVPDNAYITFGGLDWAWGSAVSPTFGIEAWRPVLSVEQQSFGWRFATAQDLLNAPLATAFLFPGGNVPFAGQDILSGASFSANSAYTAAASAGACAAPWFSGVLTWCDYYDGFGEVKANIWAAAENAWAGMDGSTETSEQLFVRESGDVVGTPEPASIILLATGLLGIASVARRRRAS